METKDMQWILVLAVAALAVTVTRAQNQGFYLVPDPANSCTSRMWTSDNPALQDVIRRSSLQSIPCDQGKVVASNGQCVDLLRADRCFPAGYLTPEIVTRKCVSFPFLRFADPVDCAKYYGCNLPTPYNATCPVDQAFDETMLTCRRDVVCGQRPLTPRSLNPAPGVSAACLQSPTRQVADQQSCKNYYACPLGAVEEQTCPADSLFDARVNFCQPLAAVDCGDRPVTYSAEQIDIVCAANPTWLVANSETCNGFYNCSARAQSPSASYYQECAYLQLFDSASRSCRPYSMVTCGSRKALKYRCELQSSECQTSHCVPCSAVTPDCRNLPNGKQPFDKGEYRNRYAQCQDGWTVDVLECQPDPQLNTPRLFDPRTLDCVSVLVVPRQFGGLAAEG